MIILQYNNDILRLRKVESEDLEFLLNLRNDEETRKYLGDQQTLTMEGQFKWFDTLKDCSDKAYYIYEYKPDNSDQYIKIGMVRTHDIDHRNHSMGVGGDIMPSFRGKGYGRMMYNLIFKLCFEQLSMNRLWLSVIEYNLRALSLYTSLGFQKMGVQRQAVLNGQTYYDYIYMDILHAEYINHINQEQHAHSKITTNI